MIPKHLDVDCTSTSTRNGPESNGTKGQAYKEKKRKGRELTEGSADKKRKRTQEKERELPPHFEEAEPGRISKQPAGHVGHLPPSSSLSFTLAAGVSAGDTIPTTARATARTTPLGTEYPSTAAHSERPSKSKMKKHSDITVPSQSAEKIMTSDPTPAFPTYTTSTGNVLTFQNAGTFLNHWAQAVGHKQPAFEYTNVFPPDYAPPSTGISKRAAKRRTQAIPVEKDNTKEKEVNPPTGSLRECTIVLPMLGTVRSGVTSAAGGRGWPNKALAKQSVSFEAVKQLLERGEMDGDFRPTPSQLLLPPASKKTADLTTDPLSTKSQSCVRWDQLKAKISDQLPPASAASANPAGIVGVAEHPFHTNPTFWSSCPPLLENSIYATILKLCIDLQRDNDAEEDECRTLCMITSRPIPLFEEQTEVPVKMSVGDQPVVSATMRMIDGGEMKSWDEGRLEQALRFTEKLLRAELQRPYKGSLDQLKWLIVPLKRDFDLSSRAEREGGRVKLKRRDIAWDEIEMVSNGPYSTPFDLTNIDVMRRQCEDAILTNPSEFSRRSYVKRLHTDLTPSSPHPTQPDKTIYEVLLSKQDTLPAPTIANQPIIEAEMTVSPKHGGHVYASANPASRGKTLFLIPELVQRHCISASVFRTASNLPHFSHSLENMLIVQEMNRSSFSSSLDLDLALQATTAPAANDDPKRNYERLEMLGDILLSLITTAHAYLKATKEGINLDKIKVERQIVCSNRSLMSYALKAGLVKYVRSKRFKAKDFTPRDWNVESVVGVTPAKIAMRTSEDGLESRPLGDKVVADVVEALLGAAYLRRKSLDDVISTMHNLKIPIHGLTAWSDLERTLSTPTPVLGKRGANGLEKVKSSEPAYMRFFNTPLSNKVLDYEFKDEKRVTYVLSLDMNDVDRRTNFDRYRMLGNAILNYFVLEYLWDAYPDEGPASLTLMKGARGTDAVRTALALELGLMDILKDGDDQLCRDIERIKKGMRNAKARAETDVKSREEEGGDSRGVHYWHDVPVIQTTSDLVEALLGAITHDSSFNLEPARTLFRNKISPFLEKWCKGPHGGLDQHPKAKMIRWMQARGCTKWRVEKVLGGLGGGEGAIVIVHDQPISRGQGPTPIAAQRKACEIAMRLLKDEKNLESICTCPTLRAENGKKSS